MSNQLQLLVINATLKDIQTCRTLLRQRAPAIATDDAIAQQILRTRPRNDEHRRRQRFVRGQIALNDECEARDLITFDRISLLNRLLIGRQCYDALSLAAYLTRDMNEENEAHAMLMTAIGNYGSVNEQAFARLPSVDARNPMTNVQLTQTELKQLEEKIFQISYCYEWVIENVLRMDMSEVY